MRLVRRIHEERMGLQPVPPSDHMTQMITTAASIGTPTTATRWGLLRQQQQRRQHAAATAPPVPVILIGDYNTCEGGSDRVPDADDAVNADDDPPRTPHAPIVPQEDACTFVESCIPMRNCRGSGRVGNSPRMPHAPMVPQEARTFERWCIPMRNCRGSCRVGMIRGSNRHRGIARRGRYTVV